MDKHYNFEPFILIDKLPEQSEEDLLDNIFFFKKTCSIVKTCFPEKLNIKKYNPDVIIYQQPWSNNIENFSEKCLTYYIPYSITNAPVCLNYNLDNFYEKLTRHFIFSEKEFDQYKSIYKKEFKNMTVVGHPKLEIYKKTKKIKNKKNYIIYAPHHSFRDESILKYGTFHWSGLHILNWAKLHPELNWVFKPHPRLKLELEYSSIMTKNEIELYYSEWEKIGIYNNKGDYFDIFQESQMLITDCGSFLIEYLPTENPVIHLVNKENASYSPTTKYVINSYYTVKNITQLEFSLNEIINKKNDPKKNERIIKLKNLNIKKMDSTKKIMEYICQDLEV